jgi:hypothetical protein
MEMAAIIIFGGLASLGIYCWVMIYGESMFMKDVERQALNLTHKTQYQIDMSDSIVFFYKGPARARYFEKHVCTIKRVMKQNGDTRVLEIHETEYSVSVVPDTMG